MDKHQTGYHKVLVSDKDVHYPHTYSSLTTMFHDVHQVMDRKLIRHRVPGADFDEVTYADDTVCISRDIEAMNKFINTIEKRN